MSVRTVLRVTTLFVFCFVSILSATAQQAADRIWTGGPILTMEDSKPRAQAIAEKDGRILAVGGVDEVMSHKGDKTEMIDLEGKTMLPGFVDAHGHAFLVGLQALSANMLPAPDGEVNSIADMQRILREWVAKNQAVIKDYNVIIGFGYDDAQLAEQRHPTRQELDAISEHIPVIVIHQSAHISTLNTAGLKAVGYDENTQEMEGGVIRREEGANFPNGVLEETPHFAAAMKLVFGALDETAGRAMFSAGMDLVASFGYTTAQEGRASTGQSQFMAKIASEGKLAIDIVAYPDVLVDRDYIAKSSSKTYVNGFRVGGAKLTIDGSPQGFTAWRDRPYYNPPKNFRSDYFGYPAASADKVYDAIDWAYDNNIHIMTHANGEAASDLLIAAIKDAEASHEPADRRPVLIHGQFLREDQVDAFKRLNVFPSLFPMHTFYWGDWHRDRTVGPTNADNISPTGWLVKRGMKFSSHHDAPVAFPDSMRVLDATVTRRSRSGDIIGPDQRVDVITALKAMTIWPAYQHFEEKEKGSLEVGKLADLVILSDDPTAMNPEKLDQIKVLQTIKEGRQVYAAGNPEK